MRSRDGNRTFSFSIQLSSLFLLSSLALNASEYLISYRYLVKNSILYNETLDISKAMKKCSGEPYDSIILTSPNNKNLKNTIRSNYQEFVDYVHKLGLHLTHNEKTVNYQNSFTTILTLKTTCFKVDFNDNFFRI